MFLIPLSSMFLITFYDDNYKKNKLSSSSDKPQFWLGFKLMLTDSIQEWVRADPEFLVKIGLLI